MRIFIIGTILAVLGMQLPTAVDAQLRPITPIVCKTDKKFLRRSLNKVQDLGELQAANNTDIAGFGSCYWGFPQKVGGGQPSVKSIAWSGLYQSENGIWFATWEILFNELNGRHYAGDSWYPAKDWQRSTSREVRSGCGRAAIRKYGECLLPRNKRAVRGYGGGDGFVVIPPNWHELKN